jgi:hypothetical protein
MFRPGEVAYVDTFGFLEYGVFVSCRGGVGSCIEMEQLKWNMNGTSCESIYYVTDYK